ncbi:MAG: OmpA family protein [Aphanocapsa sp. GSE-SYN-MK-11-07L]|nr:OmpA family protein [Aphanocapsa sp. GSE-SYN-MK-11-07L]
MLSPENPLKNQAAPIGAADQDIDQSLKSLVDILLDIDADQTAKSSATARKVSPESWPPELMVLPPPPQPSVFSAKPLTLEPPQVHIKPPGQPPSSSTAKPPQQSEFLRQAQNDIRFVLGRLDEKVTRLERKIDQPTELINPLLPLITELLTLKHTESNHSLLQALVPLIDQVIQLRAQQDQAKMGAAIGDILPAAIAHQIQHSPAAIAKAIAPEIALSIQEQAQLDPEAIAQSLGPQMGEAIKNQILVEREAMVDALYPVIGNTISKYMVEVVKSINDKVEASLSPEGILRKVRARIRGVSEAELILQESVGFKVQAILLIHKASGLVMRDLQPASSFQIEADMLAGMLTAIRSFVSECMTQPDTDSELHQIEYNASKIVLEVAGYCYLAVIIKGEPSPAFIEKIRTTLGQIVLKSGKAIAYYDGDPGNIPASVDLCLDRLLAAEPKPAPAAKFPVGIAVLLGLILIPLGFFSYRSYVAHKVELKTADALDGVPELSVYRIVPKVEGSKLTLTGRLPNDALRQQAAVVAAQVAPNWPVANQILTVDVPADPTRIAGEVERVAWIFNQKPGVAIAAQHQFNSNSVDVTGIVADFQDSQQLTQALKKIPGLAKVTSTVQIRPVLESQIYFDLNSAQVEASNLARLRSIRQFLDQNPSVALKIIGHSDPTGEQSRNQQLSRERARNVQQVLITEGISPTRLQVQVSDQLPPSITPQQPLRLSRSVRFEVFIPVQKRE